MARVAVVGAGGFVGSALVAALTGRDEDEVVAVTRANHDDLRRRGPVDVLINASCPSKRFWAEHHPDADRVATVDRTEALRRGWTFRHFVQISSMSARAQPDTVYGGHRADAERLCGPDDLVVRLGPMYGSGYRKGVLLDMLNDQPVYASGRSRQSFATVQWCAGWVVANRDRAGVVEVGARTCVTLAEVRDAVGSRSQFATDRVDDQYPVSPTGADWPDARDVIGWLIERRRGRRA